MLLVNEFDYVAGGVAADLFRENYLEVGQGGADPIEYPYAFVAPSNTGVPSGFDLDNNGAVGGGNDAFGFGVFEGQYGMLVLSKLPIDTRKVRTFQNFRWADMPDALLPDDPATPEPADWYTPEELEVAPALEQVALGRAGARRGQPQRRAGRPSTSWSRTRPRPPSTAPRTATAPATTTRSGSGPTTCAAAGSSAYVYDDAGKRGGLARGEHFVIAGDQNSDPVDGDSVDGAIQQLLDHPRIQDPLPSSEGAVEAAALQGGANLTHQGDPRYDTADFADTQPGNLRADYVLPSRDLRVKGSGVFWPVQADPLSRLTGVFPFPTSDHRAVWVDVRARR